MWFRRDLRLARQPGPARRRVADGDGAAAVRARPGAVGAGRAVPPRLPRRARCAPSTAAPQRGRRLIVVRGDPVRAGRPGRRGRSGADRVHVAADFGPYGARARPARSRRPCADAGIELVRTGSPYAVAPGRVPNGSGEPYKVYTPFSRAWSEHGWRGPVDAPAGAQLARRSTASRPTSPTRSCPTGSSCPRPARRRRCARWADVPRRARSPTTTTTRDRPGLDGTSPDVGAPEVGRDPPAHDARRPRAAARRRARRPTARSWPGGSSTPTCSSHRPETARDYLPPGVRRDGRTTEPGDAARGLAARAAPASRSSTPACASCGRPAGCTTGSG